MTSTLPPRRVGRERETIAFAGAKQRSGRRRRRHLELVRTASAGPGSRTRSP